jgi:RNA polymerase primary sigma factor
VSRRHAVVEFRGSQYFIRDCNSSNGSLVNGDRVSERSLRDGDLVACRGSIRPSLRRRFAKRYRGFGLVSRLIHEGNLGMIEAARRFDASRNVKFISYAVWWIRQAIMQALSDQTRAFSFPPKLFPTFGNGVEDVSLNEPIGREGARERGDTLVEESVLIEEEMIHQADLNQLAGALLELDGKEREVVRLRFGFEDDEPRTLQEIGDRLHLSRERVRQIEARAKEKLRRSAKLRSHLN